MGIAKFPSRQLGNFDYSRPFVLDRFNVSAEVLSHVVFNTNASMLIGVAAPHAFDQGAPITSPVPPGFTFKKIIKRDRMQCMHKPMFSLPLHLQFHAAWTVESAVGVNDVISLQIELIYTIECFFVEFGSK